MGRPGSSSGSSTPPEGRPGRVGADGSGSNARAGCDLYYLAGMTAVARPLFKVCEYAPTVQGGCNKRGTRSPRRSGWPMGPVYALARVAGLRPGRLPELCDMIQAGTWGVFETG